MNEIQAILQYIAANLPKAASKEEIATAVWGANLSDFNAPNTMGHFQNQVDGLTDNQATMLLEIYRLYGLDPTKPLTVTNTSRSVAGITQTIDANNDRTIVTRQ